MKKLSLTLFIALIGVINCFGQVNVCPAYGTGWAGNAFETVNGSNHVLNVTGNTANQTMYRPVGNLSNTWQSQLNFTPTQRSSSGACFTLLAVTAGNTDWNFTANNNNYTTFSDVDGVILTWNNVADNPNSVFWIYTKDGTNRVSIPTTIPIILNRNYTIIFERLNATSGRLTVTDNTVQGTLTFDFVIPNTVTGLNTIQQGTIIGAATSRTCSATLSNLAIYDVLVAPITGSNVVCRNQIIALESATPGGVWTSTNTAVATIRQSGVVTGVSVGIARINYTVGSGTCTSVVSMDITVRDVLTFQINGPSPVCPSTSGNSYSVSPAVVGADYTWNIQDAPSVTLGFPVNGSNNTLATIPASVPNNQFTIRCQGKNECGSSQIVTKLITVNAKPVAPIVTCSGTSGTNTCVNLVVSNAGSNSIAWTVGGVVQGTSTSFLRPLSTNVTCTFTNASGCKSSTGYSPAVTCTYAQRKANEEVVENYALKVYPNPNEGNFTFVTNGYTGKASIINILGKVVEEIEIDETRTIYDVNMSNKPKGTYLLKLTGESENHVSVFVVE